MLAELDGPLSVPAPDSEPRTMFDPAVVPFRATTEPFTVNDAFAPPLPCGPEVLENLKVLPEAMFTVPLKLPNC